jgi:hypothetical protein
MEPGFLLEQTQGGGWAAVHWAAGAPKKSFWTGLSLKGAQVLEVATWRCRRCGYLESYAGEG